MAGIRFSRRPVIWLGAGFALTAMVATLAACERRPANFSQYPGYRVYFAARPPSAVIPTAVEQALLRRYRPRVFLPAGHPGPVEFYADYIAHGQMQDGSGRLVSRQVTREILNQNTQDPGAVFTHALSPGPRHPVLAADDITEPEKEIDPELTFLPPGDAFYTFQGFLGQRRRLQGRDGPPGADYNTWPELKPKGVQMLAFYWRDGNGDDLARFERTWGTGAGPRSFAEAQAAAFAAAWRRAAAAERACPGALAQRVAVPPHPNGGA